MADTEVVEAPVIVGAADDAESNGKGAPKAPVDTGEGAKPKPVEKPVEKTEEVKKTPEQIAADKAEADKKKTDEKKPDEEENADWAKQYVKIDNPHAQAALDLLEANKVSPVEANAIFAKAIETRDLSQVDWKLAEAKLGKPTTLLLKAGIEKYYNDLQQTTFKTEATVHGIMGGEANWVTVRDYFKKQEAAGTDIGKKVPEFRTLLDQNGAAAELAAKEMRRLYDADKSNKSLGTKQLVTGDTTTTVLAGASITREEYQQEIQKLRKVNAPQDAFDALRARRKQSMLAGI